MNFQNSVNSALVTTIIKRIVVKKGSTKEEIHLDIHLKFGGPWEAVFNRVNASLCFTHLKRGKAEGKILCGERQTVDVVIRGKMC